jgi:segregation and condensation protein B
MLEDRGWIDAIGHRDVPGRPALFATTRQFLDDLGLTSLDQLPPLQQIGKDALQGEAALSVHAMEQSLEASMNQASIEFAEPASGTDEQVHEVSVAQGGDEVIADESESQTDAVQAEQLNEHEDSVAVQIQSPTEPSDDPTQPQ